MRGHVNVRSSVSFDGQSNVNVAVVCADDPPRRSLSSRASTTARTLRSTRSAIVRGRGETWNAETDRVADRSPEVNRHPEE